MQDGFVLEGWGCSILVVGVKLSRCLWTEGKGSRARPQDNNAGRYSRHLTEPISSMRAISVDVCKQDIFAVKEEMKNVDYMVTC